MKIDRHTRDYESAKKELVVEYEDFKEIETIKKTFEKNKIKCFKYNYALDKDVQHVPYYNSYF